MLIPSLDRRHLLAGLAIGSAATLLPARIAFARGAETDKRFVFVIQRGATDGLSTVAPVGDPAFAAVRGELASDFAEAAKLDSMFALHPSLPTLGELFQAKQALFIHATSSPYRDRSHFDGQNVLETGGIVPYQLKDGWLNRTLDLLPGGTRALAVGPNVPAALRGPNEVSSYGNSGLPDANDDLLRRVGQLYAGDAQLHALWDAALSAKGMASGTGGMGQDPADLGKLAAQLLSGVDGARIAMIETDGWDTHFNQAARLQRQFKGLDGLVSALRDGLGPVWNNTVVLVATEFGRTAAINGTKGTDHGTGSLAMLLGGAVAGGRVVADWPGLAQSQLYQARDLKPTTALDAAIAGAVGGHFGLDAGKVLAKAFPGSKGVPVEVLVRV
jgi:uncharacterized protein (DUF1501 family)